MADGYKIEDVERALNIDAIQKFTGVEGTDMAMLFALLVAKIEGSDIAIQQHVAEPSVVDDTETVAHEVSPEKPKKRGRPRKVTKLPK